MRATGPSPRHPGIHPRGAPTVTSAVGIDSGLSRYQEALLAFGRRSTAQPALGVLLQDAAMLVGETLQADWVGIAEIREGNQLVLQVGRAAPNVQFDGQHVHRTTLDAVDSMAASALRSACILVSENVAADTRFDDPFLRHLGIVAAATIPLHINGRPFGALGVYASHPRKFRAEEIGFAETIGHLLSASSARVKLEEELKLERDFRSTVLGMVRAMVLSLDAEGRVTYMNPECERATGYKLEEVRGRSFWSLFVAPEEHQWIQQVFRGSVGNGVPSEFAGALVSKDGSRRQVAWSMKAMASGEIQTLILAGSDQTAKESTLTGRAGTRPERALPPNALRQPAPPGTARPVEPAPPGNSPGQAAPSLGAPGSALSPNDPAPSPGPPGGREQRSSPRRPYRYRQRVAPMYEGIKPAKRLFFEVECKDISAGGIAFYMNRLPDFETVVLALGKPPTESYFTARVMRVARAEEQGRIRYLVGCRFLGRINL